ncbi:Phospholipase D precursor [compost metagenome]
MGLKPNTTYYYQFEAFGKKSLTGATRTAYGAIDELPVKLAFADGNNYTTGYFNAYGRIAEMKDLNAVVVVSGYIDEDAGTTEIRAHIPKIKTETLQDYRNRYAQYHLDKDLMKAHASHPFIVVWEKQKQEVISEKWNDNNKAAEQAFVEWLPVRVAKGEFQRKLSYGKMLEMLMIETQTTQNTGLIASTNALLEQDAVFLEQPHREWLTNQLNYSTANWKILVNRNLMSTINADFEPITNKTYDVWDNHLKDKESLIGFIRSFSLKNIVMVTGGFHNSLGAEVADAASSYDPQNGRLAAIVEVAIPSISASNLIDQDSNAGSSAEAKCLNKAVNPHIKTANFNDHGFVIMNFTKKETKINWYYMKENKLNDITKLKSQTEMTVKNGVSILEK